MRIKKNSRQPENLIIKRQSDSLNKSQLTLSHGVDEGGVVLMIIMMDENQSS
jgi:hypothetical protein